MEHIIPPDAAPIEYTRGPAAAPKPVTSIEFTRLRNKNGPLSKRFWVDGDVLKKAPAAALTDGTAERVKLQTLQEFADLAGSLRSEEALAYGITAAEDARVVTQRALKKGAYPGAIARDLDHFAWSSGAGVFMLDFDKPSSGEIWSAHDLDAMLCRALPWWEAVERFYRPSVSAYIYHENDGLELSGAGSWRCYVIADIAANIPFLATMHLT